MRLEKQAQTNDAIETTLLIKIKKRKCYETNITPNVCVIALARSLWRSSNGAESGGDQRVLS